MKILKIYGERNSGTNYLAMLLQNNLNICVHRGVAPSWIGFAQKIIPFLELSDIYFSLTYRANLGWKHSFPFMLQTKPLCDIDYIRNIVFVTITKNPYSWLLSLYKRPHHLKRKYQVSFEDFLLQSLPALKRENADSGFSSPVDIWNLKTGAYLQLCDSGYLVVNIRYEDLIADPEGTICHLATKYELHMKPCFTNIMRSTKGDRARFADYQHYYLNEIWRSELSDEAILLINARLNKDIVLKLGYSLIYE